MDPNTVLYAVAGGLAAVLFAIVLIGLVLRTPTGNDRMREIAAAIQEGASAYLNRQYTVIAIIGAVIAIAIGLAINWKTAALYVVGAVLSAAAGYVGMNIAVRSNLRTAEAARGGLNNALQVAFRGGSVTGFMVVGGEWFLMWQSQTWNGQDAAFRMFLVEGIVLLVLLTPELDDHERLPNS